MAEDSRDWKKLCYTCADATPIEKRDYRLASNEEVARLLKDNLDEENVLLPDGGKVCTKCVRLLRFIDQAARKREAFISSFTSLHKKAFPLKRPASPSEEEKRSRARLSGDPTGATVSFTSNHYLSKELPEKISFNKNFKGSLKVTRKSFNTCVCKCGKFLLSPKSFCR